MPGIVTGQMNKALPNGGKPVRWKMADCGSDVSIAVRSNIYTKLKGLDVGITFCKE